MDAGGTVVAVFNVDGTYHAIQNTCRHRGGPLGEGELSGSVVTCPWHGWQYEVTTGGNVADPEIRVERHGVRVEAGEIFVSPEALLGRGLDGCGDHQTLITSAGRRMAEPVYCARGRTFRCTAGTGKE